MSAVALGLAVLQGPREEDAGRALDRGDVVGELVVAHLDRAARERRVQDAQHAARVAIGERGVRDVEAGDRRREAEDVAGLDAVGDLRDVRRRDHVARLSVEAALHRRDLVEDAVVGEGRRSSCDARS